MAGEVLNYADVQKSLACRPAAVLLDRVFAESDTKYIGSKGVSINEWFFCGHFPGHPIMPGVLQVEAMTQLAEMAVWKKLDPKREGEIYLKALRRVKFRRPVNPGDRLHIEAEVKSVSGDSAEVSATVRTNSGPSCQAEISLAVRPRVQPAKMPAPFSNYDKSEGIHMDINKLMAVIPHRYPFLLVDYIQSVEGCRVTAVKNVTSSEPLLREYPDKYLALTNSVLPEIIAQTGCVYMLSNESAKGKIAYFMAIEKAEFLKPIHPGDQLVCIIDIPDNKSRFGKGDGFIQVDGETVAKTTLTFALVDPS